MKFLSKLNYRLLYLTWAVLFVVTASLGLLFPGGAEHLLPLRLAAAIFFLPPWFILAKARAAGDGKHIRLVRYLALGSLVLTVVLLCLNLFSAGRGEALGAALNAALTIVSAPLVCSNLYAMPLFLWGTLLVGARSKK